MVQCIIKSQTEFSGWWMLLPCPMSLLLLQVEGLWCCIIFCNQSEYPGVFRWKSSELERTLDITCLDCLSKERFHSKTGTCSIGLERVFSNMGNKYYTINRVESSLNTRKC